MVDYEQDDPTSLWYNPLAHLDTVCAQEGCYRVTDGSVYCCEHAHYGYEDVCEHGYTIHEGCTTCEREER